MSLAFVGKKEEVAAAPAGKVRLTRRSLLAGAAGLIGLSAAGTAGYAAAIEPQQLVVTPYALKPRGWPAGRKLTITVIADLHAGGPDMPLPNVQRIVDTANALKSDLIVMLGDYIARYRFAVERIPEPVWAAELGRLQAPLGVWAILGNHDWWDDLAAQRARRGPGRGRCRPSAILKRLGGLREDRARAAAPLRPEDCARP